MSLMGDWFDWLRPLDRPRVLELGTRAWDNRPPRHHRDAVLAANPGASWVGADALAGDGVDVVADAHRLSEVFAAGHFDGWLCVATLEHFARPWVAAVELAKVTRPGGRGLVQTHQTFPLHGYPSDYFRFSAAALAEVFSVEAGWRVLAAGHDYPCRVVPLGNAFAHARDWNFEAEAYLNASAVVERIGGGP